MIFVLILLLGFMIFRLLYLERSLKRLEREWKECWQANTNRLLPFVSSDRAIVRLTAVLNDSLKPLKEKEIELNDRKKRIETDMADLAHDFNTPLTAALGYTQLFWQEDSYAQKEEDVRRIENRLHVLKKLSDELFELSWVNDPDKELPLTELSPGKIIEETILGMASLWIEKGMDPCLYLQKGNVLANREGAARVFENLLSNALKYTSGSICIRMPEPDTVVIENEIKDQTVHIAALKKRYSTVHFGQESHGLGLPIAKGYMEKMKGSLRCEIKNGRLRMVCRFASSSPEIPFSKRSGGNDFSDSR